MSQIIQTKNLMSKKIITIGEDESLSEAKDLMLERRFRQLPVVNEMGVIVGVLSLSSFDHLNQLENLKVKAFAMGPIEWVHPETPLSKAIIKMLEKRASFILVGDQKAEVSGIITTDDLLWLLAKKLESAESKRSPLTLFDLQFLDEMADRISFTGI